MKPSILFSSVALTLVLGACASTPSTQYYTLSSTEARAASSKAAFAFSLSGVEIPQQVDRPQIVLSHTDGTQVTLLNDSQWAAPLANEIRNALSQDLSGRLGALDIDPRTAPKDLPLWVLAVTVHRFESIYGDRAVLEATWRQSLRTEGSSGASICRAAIEVPVQAGVSQMVAGHQQALERLSNLMAEKVSGRALQASEGVTLKGCV